MYQKSIIEVTGCSSGDAPEIEEMMRTTYGTLDNITARQFNKEARECYKALLFMRTPEGIAYLEKLEQEMKQGFNPEN